MPIWKQKMLSRLYRNEAGEGGDGGNGGAGTGGAGEGQGGSGEGQGGAGDGAGTGGAGEGEGKTPPPAGKKTPSDEEARLLKENMKRKEENADLKKRLDSVSAIQAQLEELGGLDALKALVQDKRTSEEKALEAKGDWERLKARMQEENNKKLTEAATAAEQLKAELEKSQKQINELTIGSKFGQSKFIGEDLTLTPTKARALYGSHFDYVDGKVVGYDKPRGEADRTMFVDNMGNPVDFDDAMKKIVDSDPEKEYLYKSKMAAGAGSDTKTTTKTPEKKSVALDPTSKIAAALAAQKATKK
jgi:hypothetical protein